MSRGVMMQKARTAPQRRQRVGVPGGGVVMVDAPTTARAPESAVVADAAGRRR